QFLGIGFDGENFRPGVLIGAAYKENDEQLLGLKPAALGEWIPGDHILELGGGGHDHPRTEAKRSLDRVFDLLSQTRKIPLFRAKHDVSALDVGLRVLESQRRVNRPERFHADQVVSTDVDAAQQRNNDRHSALESQ